VSHRAELLRTYSFVVALPDEITAEVRQRTAVQASLRVGDAVVAGPRSATRALPGAGRLTLTWRHAA
jgi:hypothetical protein